jgi:signal peptidase
MKRILKTISDILFISGLVVAGLFLVSHFTGRKPFQVFIVSSGSMEPAIKTGSAIVVSPKSDYQITDIATYYSGSDKKTTTTHRIVATDGVVYKMAGDANDQPDPVLVPREKIIGSVRLSVPYVGYLAAQAKTPKGFILLVIVPATIIIYEELRSLFLDIKKIISTRKARAGVMRTGAQREAGNDQAGEHLQSLTPNARTWIAKPAIVLPIFFALLIPLTLSISYFIDRETSSGNSFTGALPTPTPIPTDQFSILSSQFSIDNITPTPEPTIEPTPTPIPTEPLSTLNSQLSIDTITPTETPMP